MHGRGRAARAAPGDHELGRIGQDRAVDDPLILELYRAGGRHPRERLREIGAAEPEGGRPARRDPAVIGEGRRPADLEGNARHVLEEVAEQDGRDRAAGLEREMGPFEADHAAPNPRSADGGVGVPTPYG